MRIIFARGGQQDTSFVSRIGHLLLGTYFYSAICYEDDILPFSLHFFATGRYHKACFTETVVTYLQTGNDVIVHMCSDGVWDKAGCTTVTVGSPLRPVTRLAEVL
jgi:hypothetical protein